MTAPQPIETLRSSTETARNRPALLRYIFCAHDNSGIADVLPHLRDADVVAFELVTHYENAALVESDLNRISRGDVLGEDTLQSGQHKNWMYHIAGEFTGEGKQYSIVDVSKTPGSPYDLRTKNLYAEMETAQECIREHFRWYGSPYDARDWYRIIAGSIAETTPIRDRAIASKVRKLITHNPGKVIGLLIGAGHLDLPNQMQTDAEIEYAQTKFYPPPSEEDRLGLYGALSTLALMHQKGIEAPDTLVDRAMIQFLISIVLKVDQSDSRAWGVNYFTDAEISKVMNELDRYSKKAHKDQKASSMYRGTIGRAARLSLQKMNAQQ